MTDHYNAVRGALTVGGTGNVTAASTASGKARPLSTLPTGWQGGLRFDDPNGVDWELSRCTALGGNVFSRDTFYCSSTGSKLNLAVGSTVLQTVLAEDLNLFTSKAAISGVYAVGQALTAAFPAGTVGTIQFTRTMVVAPFTKTAISGATANGVNSLPYTVTSADAGYRIDVDCSNQVSAVTGGLVPAVPATVSQSGVMRLIGSGAQQTAAGPMTGSYNSAVIKLQAPGPAIGARIIVTNSSPNFGVASMKVAMASTDISACDTAAKAYTPMIGGATKNVISTTSDTGFVKGKWGGGNVTSRRLYPSNSVLPSFGYNSQEEYLCSDVIPLVPKRATDRTNEEYYYILRLTGVGAVGTDGQAQIEGGTGKVANILYNQWLNTNGADSPLMCIGGLGNNVDAVDGNLATIPGGIANGWSPVFHVEWIYPNDVSPVTFLCPGDSISEGYEWLRWAIQRRNTNPLRPLHYVNNAASTTRSGSFRSNMYLYLQANAKPNHIMYPMMSPNNYSPSSAFNLTTAPNEYADLVELVQYCASIGVKLHIWTPINWGPNPTDPNDLSTPWNYLYNRTKAYCAANNVGFCDINGDPTVDRSDYTSTNLTGWINSADHLHPSDPVGKAGFARVFGQYLTSIGY